MSSSHSETVSTADLCSCFSSGKSSWPLKGRKENWRAALPVPALRLPQWPWQLYLSLVCTHLQKKWVRDLVTWVRSQPWGGTSSSYTKSRRTTSHLAPRMRSHVLREVFSLPHNDRKWLKQLWLPTFYCKGVWAGTVSTNFLIKLNINRFTW